MRLVEKRMNGNITREEFVELRSQVSSIATAVEHLSSSFLSSLKERESTFRAEISRVDSETRNRFEKNEELAAEKARSDLEGRRWLIGTLAAMFVGILTLGGWWSTSIKQAVVAELTTSLSVIQAQNASSSKDRDDMRSRLANLEDQQNKTQAELSAFITKTAADEREIETQFWSFQQSSNATIADQWRVMAELWDTLHEMGAKLPARPSGPYFTPAPPPQH
jgi:cell division protein FtsB